MRLEVTRRAELAVRALVVLTSDGGRWKAPALAERLETTPGFLTQVMAPLTREGWVRSEPGPTGGYVARIGPADLDVLSVLEAVDGPTDTGRCVVADRPCGAEATCALHHAWGRARTELLGTLAGTRLDDLPNAVA